MITFKLKKSLLLIKINNFDRFMFHETRKYGYNKISFVSDLCLETFSKSVKSKMVVYCFRTNYKKIQT